MCYLISLEAPSEDRHCEIQAFDETAGFLGDDPIGVAALWALVSQLTDEPRPPESFPNESPDLRRLRAGRYRVSTIEVTAQISADANHVTFGVFLNGGGQL